MSDRVLLVDSSVAMLAGVLALSLGWGMTSAVVFVAIIWCILRPVGRFLAVKLVIGGVAALALLFAFGAQEQAARLSNVVYVLFLVLIVELLREGLAKLKR